MLYNLQKRFSGGFWGFRAAFSGGRPNIPPTRSNIPPTRIMHTRALHSPRAPLGFFGRVPIGRMAAGARARARGLPRAPLMPADKARPLGVRHAGRFRLLPPARPAGRARPWFWRVRKRPPLMPAACADVRARPGRVALHKFNRRRLRVRGEVEFIYPPGGRVKVAQSLVDVVHVRRNAPPMR